MGRGVTLAVVAIAAATLVACGSTTSTSAETPPERDTAEGPELAPDEPVAPPDASPPAPPSVTLLALADTMKSTGADDVIAALGDLGLTVRCPTSGWKADRARILETASCPVGPIRLGDVDGVMEVVVERRIDNASASGATIIITAVGERAEWERRVRAMLLQARNARDEIEAIAEKPLQQIVALGWARARFQDETGEPLRLLIRRFPSRGLRQ